MADYFTDPAAPVAQTRGVSSTIRGIYTSIATAFTKIAAYTGNGGKLVRINSGATAQEAMALGTANQVLGMNAGATAYEHKTLTSTTNQVTVTQGAGTVTFSTPQDIHTGASPTFNALTVTSITVNGVVLGTSAASMRTALGLAIGTNVQAWDADLDTLAAMAATGIAVRTGSGTWANRTITAGTGCSVANGDGVSGNPTITLTPGVGLGDILGPGASIDNEIVLFSGTSGQLVKRATLGARLTLSGGVLSADIQSSAFVTANSCATSYIFNGGL